MVVFMFSEEHLGQVLDGTKTQTRRQWDSPRVTVGKSYRAVRKDVQGAMFTPREECPAYIEVTDLWEEPLGDLTPADAEAEGGYTVDEFKDKWRDINGAWTPDETVYAVEFVGHATDPRKA